MHDDYLDLKDMDLVQGPSSVNPAGISLRYQELEKFVAQGRISAPQGFEWGGMNEQDALLEGVLKNAPLPMVKFVVDQLPFVVHMFDTSPRTPCVHALLGLPQQRWENVMSIINHVLPPHVQACLCVREGAIAWFEKNRTPLEGLLEYFTSFELLEKAHQHDSKVVEHNKFIKHYFYAVERAMKNDVGVSSWVQETFKVMDGTVIGHFLDRSTADNETVHAVLSLLTDRQWNHMLTADYWNVTHNPVAKAMADKRAILKTVQDSAQPSKPKVM